jgi:hypothetical protein
MENIRSVQCLSLFLGAFLIAGLLATKCQASTEIKLCESQTVYIPIYSHVYIGDQERPFYLTATLSIRNIDLSPFICFEKFQ